MMPIGAMWHRIDAEPKLSDADFSLDAPVGYSVERLTAPTISEDDMLAYLRAVAEFQRGLLPETIDHSAIDRERLDYVGSGVKLGSEKEIFCWYRLKGASTYHVVYGDLQIRELKRGELPLIPQ